MNLLHGDCIELMKTIESGSVDLCVSDIAYKVISGGQKNGKNSNRPKGILLKNNQLVESPKFSEWLPELYRVMKEGSHLYLMVNFLNLNDLMNECKKNGFKLINLLIWEKNNCTPSQFYMKNCEYIVFLRKGKIKYINDIGGSKTVHKFNNIIGKKLHTTEKPIGLMEFYVHNSSNENDLVLDMFMGSGSTGVACKNLNRNFIGIEKDDKYFEIAKNRIEQHIPPLL